MLGSWDEALVVPPEHAVSVSRDQVVGPVEKHAQAARRNAATAFHGHPSDEPIISAARLLSRSVGVAVR